MNLEKLFGWAVKVDIIKYLLFKRQWISIRALEKDTTWSFPAIKKQVDQLNEAGVLEIQKANEKWSIYVVPSSHQFLRDMFCNFLLIEIQTILKDQISQLYVWKFFGEKWADFDLVVIFNTAYKDKLSEIKSTIESTCKSYFIDQITAVFMSSDDFEKRYRMADRWTLTLLKNWRKI